MTQQINNSLIINQNEFLIEEDLLSYFFELNPNSFIKPKYTVTCLWRGYVATFEILENSLFLNRIDLLIGSDFTFEEINIYDKNNVFRFFSGFIEISNEYYYFEKGILKQKFKIDNDNSLMDFVDELNIRFKHSKHYRKSKKILEMLDFSEEEMEKSLIFLTNHLKYNE